jgi:hypothetical protein
MRKFQFHFVFALASGILLALLTWLLRSMAALRDVLDFIVFIPRITAMWIFHTPHGAGSTGEIVFWALVFGQAFIFGFGLSLLFRRLRGNDDVA